jgi:uncharacterized phiE125 gp8 family phage protein
MAVKVIVPPALEPVSVEEAKAQLRLESSSEDALLMRMISAARETVEGMGALALISRRVVETRDGWRLDETGAARLALAPVTAVHAVRLADAAGTFVALAPERWSPRLAGSEARIAFAHGAPAPVRAAAGIEIEYTAGFGPNPADVPAALRQAVLILVSALFEQRESGEPPASVRALVAPFAQVRL